MRIEGMGIKALLSTKELSSKTGLKRFTHATNSCNVGEIVIFRLVRQPLFVYKGFITLSICISMIDNFTSKAFTLIYSIALSSARRRTLIYH